MAARSPLAPVTIAVFDRFGNPWSGVKVSVVLVPIGGSKGHFMGGSVIHAKTINGVATFSKLVMMLEAAMSCVPWSAASA